MTPSYKAAHGLWLPQAAAPPLPAVAARTKNRRSDITSRRRKALFNFYFSLYLIILSYQNLLTLVDVYAGLRRLAYAHSANGVV